MKSHRVGDHEWIDDVGEFDEERRDQEPGYSDDNKGCFGFTLKVAAVAVACLVLLII